MKFSIIIINYKTKELTANCLNSLFILPDSQGKEIILIDNASNDGSIEYLEKEFGNKVKLIKNEINLGFAGANNQGAAIAAGKYLIFLNSDTIVKEDIFQNIDKLFSLDEKIGIISPRLMMENNEPQPTSFGRFPTLWRLITREGLRKPKIKPGTKNIEVDWVSGCCLAIRQSIFKQLDGWDEQFFLYYEDVDLCKRVKKAGYKVVVNLESQITHLGGKSLALNKERKKYYYEAQDYYFMKHYGIIISILVKIAKLPVRLLKF